MTKSLIKKALKVILITEKASAANFQRLLGIGYAQAAHLLDELQELKLVGKPNGEIPRTINKKEIILYISKL